MLDPKILFSSHERRYQLIQFIPRWCFLFVLLFSICGIYSILHRFSVYKIPNELHSNQMQRGSYVLIDWEFSKGRALKTGDWILYGKSKSVSLGEIIAIQHSETPQYWIKANVSQLNDILCIDYCEIRGRILMTLVEAE